MHRRGFTKGMITGGILGMAAAVYLMPAIAQGNDSKGMKRMKKDSREIIDDVLHLVDDIRTMM